MAKKIFPQIKDFGCEFISDMDFFEKYDALITPQVGENLAPSSVHDLRPKIPRKMSKLSPEEIEKMGANEKEKRRREMERKLVQARDLKQKFFAQVDDEVENERAAKTTQSRLKLAADCLRRDQENFTKEEQEEKAMLKALSCRELVIDLSKEKDDCFFRYCYEMNTTRKERPPPIIILRSQPPHSPDMNVLDIAVWNGINVLKNVIEVHRNVSKVGVDATIFFNIVKEANDMWMKFPEKITKVFETDLDLVYDQV